MAVWRAPSRRVPADAHGPSVGRQHVRPDTGLPGVGRGARSLARSTTEGSPLRYLDYGWSQLAYTDEGSGAVSVVAVPGLPGRSRDFGTLAPLLAAHVRLIRVDLPGYGGSPRPRFVGMTITQRAGPVQTLIEHLGLAPVVLLSHSSGAHVVAHLSHRRPDLVRSCVLLAPPGPHLMYPQWCFQGWSLLLRLPAGRRVWAPVVRAAENAAGFQHHLTDDERAHPILDDAMLNLAEHATDLAGMSHPTLIAWARDDPMLRTKWFEEVERVVPAGPRLRYNHGGHVIQKTHANQLAPAIVEFALAGT